MAGTEGRGPPAFARRLLLWVLAPVDARAAVAELDRDYREIHATRGPAAARLWYWGQAVRSVGPALKLRWRRGVTGFEPRVDGLRGGEARMENLIRDVRYSVRRLARRPLYLTLAVVTLALGVGGTAAIMAVVRTLLVEPLPYDEPDELAVFWGDFDWSETEFVYLRDVYRDFVGVAMYTAEDVTLREGEGPARLVHAAQASAELFDVLGAGAFLGRAFREGDDVAGAEPVVVLSQGFWQGELGGDPGVVGRQLRVDGVGRTVVGVMPPGFYFPNTATRLWIPNTVNPQDGSGDHTFIGRMAPGRGIGDMDPELARITRALGERFDYPLAWDKTKGAHLRSMREYLVGDVRPTLLAVLGAMAVILLMACTNVAALMLGQVGGRSSELAVRSAMGAGRRRLAQQVLLEALLLGLLAGLVGAGLAAVGFSVLVAALPLGAIAESLTVDWTVFGAALVAAAGAGALVALAPLVSLFRAELRAPLTGVRTGAGVGGRGGRLEQTLVVVEVALAVALVAGAALLIRSVSELRGIDPGLDPEGVVAVDFAAGAGDFDGDERRRLIGRLLEEVRGLRGVTSAAVTHKLPLRGSGSSTGLAIEGRPMEGTPTTYFRIVSRDYFETMGIPITVGRAFDATDRPDGELVVIPNQALVQEYIPDRDPLVVGVSTDFHPGYARVVGVAGNVAVANLTDPPEPTRYILYDQTQWTMENQTLVVRSAGDPAATLDAVRAAIHRVDPRVAIAGATTMDGVLELAIGPARQVMTLLALLGGLALVLGAIGVYGVVAHFVGRQTREWGIRLALGLRPFQVVRRIVRQGIALVAAGVLLGIGASLALSRLLTTFLYDVGAADPLALSAAAAALLLAGALAAYLPARRAAALDPAHILRDE